MSTADCALAAFLMSWLIAAIASPLLPWRPWRGRLKPPSSHEALRLSTARLLYEHGLEPVIADWFWTNEGLHFLERACMRGDVQLDEDGTAHVGGCLPHWGYTASAELCFEDSLEAEAQRP